jgi:hypothetical protein
VQRSVEVYQDPKYIVTKPRMGLRGICSGQSDTGTRFSFSPFHCHSLLKFHSHAIDAAYSLSTLTASFNEMPPPPPKKNPRRRTDVGVKRQASHSGTQKLTYEGKLKSFSMLIQSNPVRTTSICATPRI